MKDSPFKRIVWPLASAQALLWAGLYYIFPALLGAWEQDLGFSKAELSGALTLALLTCAVLAPAAGRSIDEGQGRLLFAGATLMGAVLLVVLTQVSTLWQFYLVWLGLGVAMAGALYEPCFAILTRHMGRDSRQAITLVTLVAGFAGTIAFPTSHALVGYVGWQGVTLVFAGAIGLIAFPLVLYAVTQAMSVDREPPEAPAAFTGEPLAVGQRPIFWLLGLAFAMIALNHGALITHFLPLMEENAVHKDVAILAAAMIGPMQVTGRLIMLASEKHVSPALISVGCCAAMLIAAVSLLGIRIVPSMIVVFVVLHGAGFGIVSILRPVLVAELLGRRKFGVVSGMLAVPFLGCFAVAPVMAGFGWSIGGYEPVIMLAAAAAFVATIAFWLAGLRADGNSQ